MGVELSVGLRNTAHVLAAYGLHKLDPRCDIRIHLIEGGLRILPVLKERTSAATMELLRKLDVDVIISKRVIEVTASAVNAASGKFIPTDLTVWAVGIRVPSVLGELGLPVNKLGQMIVSHTLQVKGDDSIYAFGDCANRLWPGASSSVPPCAQAVHQQATYLSDVPCKYMDGRPVQPSAFKDLGSLVLLDHFSTVGSPMGGLIGGSMFIEDLMARLMYTSLYRMYVLALHGWVHMSVDTVAHWLRNKTNPRVKPH